MVSCEKEEECTRIDNIGGGLLPEQQIEVPCDFPEPLPLGYLKNLNVKLDNTTRMTSYLGAKTKLNNLNIG